jgi:hypothetical protein
MAPSPGAGFGAGCGKTLPACSTPVGETMFGGVSASFRLLYVMIILAHALSDWRSPMAE